MSESGQAEKGKHSSPGVDEYGKTPTWRRLSRGFVMELKEKMHERRQAMSLPSDEMLFVDSDEERTVDSSIEEDYRRRKMLEAEITLKVLDGYDTVSESSSITNSLCFQEVCNQVHEVDKNEISDLSCASVEDGRSVTYIDSFTESVGEDIEYELSDVGDNDFHALADGNMSMQYEAIATKSGIIYDTSADTDPVIPPSRRNHDDNDKAKSLDPKHGVWNEKCKTTNEDVRFVTEEIDRRAVDQIKLMDDILKTNIVLKIENDNAEDMNLPKNKGDIPKENVLLSDRDNFKERPMTDRLQNDCEPEVEHSVGVKAERQSLESALNTENNGKGIAYSLSNIDDKSQTSTEENEQVFDQFVECLAVELANDTVVNLKPYNEMCAQLERKIDRVGFHHDTSLQNISCNKGPTNIEAMASEKSAITPTALKIALSTTRRKMFLKNTVNVPLQRCIEKARLVASIKVTMDKARTLTERMVSKAAYDKAVKDFMVAIDNLLVEHKHQENIEQSPSTSDKIYSADDIQMREKGNSDPIDILRTPIPRKRNSPLPAIPRRQKINSTTSTDKHGTGITEMAPSTDEQIQDLSKLNRGNTFILSEKCVDIENSSNACIIDNKDQIISSSCKVHKNRSGNTECISDGGQLENVIKSKRCNQGSYDHSSDNISTLKYRGKENNNDPDLHVLVEANKQTDDYKNRDALWGKEDASVDIDVMLEQNEKMREIKIGIEDYDEATFVMNSMEEEKKDKTFQINDVVIAKKIDENTIRIDTKPQNKSSDNQDTSVSEDETLNLVASICNCEIVDDLNKEKDEGQNEGSCQDIPTNFLTNGGHGTNNGETATCEIDAEFIEPLYDISEGNESLFYDNNDVNESLKPTMIRTVGDHALNSSSYTGRQKSSTQTSSLSSNNQMNKNLCIENVDCENDDVSEIDQTKKSESSRINPLNNSKHLSDMCTKVDQEISCSPVDVDYKDKENSSRENKIDECPWHKRKVDPVITNCVCNKALNSDVKTRNAVTTPNGFAEKNNFVTDSISVSSSTSGEYSLRLFEPNGQYLSSCSSVQLETVDELDQNNPDTKEKHFTFSPSEMVTREKSANDVVELVCSEHEEIFHFNNDPSPVIKCIGIEDKELQSERKENGLKFSRDCCSINSSYGFKKAVSESPSSPRKQVAFYDSITSAPTTCKFSVSPDSDKAPFMLHVVECVGVDNDQYRFKPSVNFHSKQTHQVHVSKCTNTLAAKVEDAAIQVDEMAFTNNVETQNGWSHGESQTDPDGIHPNTAEDLQYQFFEVNKSETLIMDKLCNIEKSLDLVTKLNSDFDVIHVSLDNLKCANAEAVTSLKHYVNEAVGKVKHGVEDSVKKLSFDVQEQIGLINIALEKLQQPNLGESSRTSEESIAERENVHALRMRVVELKSQRDAEKMYHKITRESLRALERDHDRLRQEILLAPYNRRKDRTKSSHLQMVINETLQSQLDDRGIVPLTSTPIKSKGSPCAIPRKGETVINDETRTSQPQTQKQ